MTGPPNLSTVDDEHQIVLAKGPWAIATGLRTHTRAHTLPVPLWPVRGTRARPEPLRPLQPGVAGGAAEHEMEPRADRCSVTQAEGQLGAPDSHSWGSAHSSVYLGYPWARATLVVLGHLS